MSYDVKIGAAPRGCVLAVPPLLARVGAYLASIPRSSVGWFDSFAIKPIAKEWSPAHAKRLQRHGFVFMGLPDGSKLVLLDAGGAVPIVALLDSEGDRRTVADSLEEFLGLWSRGETRISELHHETTGPGLAAFRTWLKKQKLGAPRTTPIDFQAWLDGDIGGVPPAAPVVPRTPTKVMAKLGPRLRALAALVGTRADAPATLQYIEKTLEKKRPTNTNEWTTRASVDASKAGVELGFSHEVMNDAYPPVAATKGSFVPYLAGVWLGPAIREPVLGVPWKATLAQARKALGTPTSSVGAGAGAAVPEWSFVLDTSAHVVLSITFAKELRARLHIAEATELERDHRVSAGLFLGWAATRGLLDTKRLAAHADLVAKIAKRKAQGSALWDAFGRGLWDDFLVDRPGLRLFAFEWFHNMDDAGWITQDLIGVFGKRRGPHDHDEPKLADDTWEAVRKATKVLDARFARFLP